MPFIQQEENNTNQQNNTVTTGGGMGAGGTGASATSVNPQNKQGSGRFTNLNKYVTANQQGSANLSNRLGTGIQNQLSSKEQDTNTASNKVASDISTGTQNVNQAKGEQQKLQNIADQFKTGSNFSILNNDRGTFGQAQNNLQEFTSNPNYQTFKNFQAGQGVDEQSLGTAQQNAAQSAQNYQNLFNQRQQQIGTSAGREQALNEFVGGSNQAVRPSYSAGQRKLDNLILSQNPNSVKNLINTVGANQTNVNQALNTVQQNATNLADLTKSEQDTINAINNSAKAAQGNFQGAFDQNKINEVNTARQQNFENASNQLKQNQISQALYNQLKGASELGGDMSTFNLLSNADLGSQNRLQNDYLQRLANAQNANDIVSQGDVDTDTLLAGIVGQGQKFRQAGNTDVNAQLRESGGKSNLINDILAEQQRQTQEARGTNLGMEAYGGESYLNDQNVYDALSGAMSGKARITTYTPTANTQQLKDIQNAGTHNMFNADRNVGAVGQSFDTNYGAARNAVGNLYNGNYLADLNQATQDIMLANNPQLANEIINNRRNADMSSINQALDARYSKLRDYMTQRGFGNRLNIV